MTPPTAPERCPTCDREGCLSTRRRLAAEWQPHIGVRWRTDKEMSEQCRIAEEVCANQHDCESHAVDWRARAIAAEIRAEEAEAHGAGSDALIDAICQRVGARDTGCGGQTVEAGEMRRRMNMTQRIDMLTTAAAQWAKVAPLIERLREAAKAARHDYATDDDATIDPRVTGHEMIDAAMVLLAATEATP